MSRDLNSSGRRRPSASIAIALLALFVALGGTATALSGKFRVKRDDIAPRAVSTKQLAGKSINAAKLKPKSVRSAQIRDRSVGAWKLRLGSTAVTAGESSTTSKTPVDLGGPTATVKVPANGLVAIQAGATMRATGGNDAEVYLYSPTEVTNPVKILGSGSTEFRTRYSVPGSTGSGSDTGVGNKVRAGWIVMPAAPGERTYQLRYSTSGGTAIFKDRRLSVVVVR